VTDLQVSDIRQFTIRLSGRRRGRRRERIGTSTNSSLDIAYHYRWTSMRPLPVTTNPPRAGFAECKVAAGLSACTTYYFAIKTKNAINNWSAISNVPSARTLCAPSFVAECDEPPTSPAVAGTLLVPSITGATTVAVPWTIPQADGTPMDYDLRYSTSTIAANNFASAKHVTMSTLPHVINGQTCRVVDCLAGNTNYYFAVKIKDQWGNWSPMSNVVTAMTTSGFATCEPGYALRPAPDEEGSLSLSPSPNPARNRTSFQITVPGGLGGAAFRVQVFDVAGRRVRSLVDRNASPGLAKVEWDLLDDAGQRVAPAFYVMRVEMGNTRKVFPVVVVN
jgi:hypothetical protein